jgi:hypothetical protein
MDRAAYSSDLNSDAERVNTNAIQNDWEEHYKIKCNNLDKTI